jgi:hypothetical protein
VCRTSKMAATLYPLCVPPRPWHTVGLYYFVHLHVSNGFDRLLIVVDILTQMAFFAVYKLRNSRGNYMAIYTWSQHSTRIAPSDGQ